MIQLQQAIHSYSPLLDRATDFSKLRKHALNIFNSMAASLKDYVGGTEIPNTQFIIAGYSWYRRRFEIDILTYNKGEKRFIRYTTFKGIGNFGRIMFSGDWARVARQRLIQILRERYGNESVTPQSPLKRKFDMEPFQVLREIVSNSTPRDTVGGAPQILKITLYMECRRLAVYWPDKKSGEVFLGGRRLLEYENIDNWILDPYTFKITHPYYSPTGNIED
jgi:hypothetical protein